jgi:hypothetical protein
VVDTTPYILVDNQRISPIGWSRRSDSANIERKGPEEQIFGIVDRVTISREAMEKSRCLEEFAQVDSSTPKNLSNKSPVVTSPVLTYSPRKLR